MFTYYFPAASVRAMATKARDEKVPVRMVGDEGVYIYAPTAHRLPEVYATNCNPTTMAFDEWWQAKNDGWGGDDGSTDFGATEILNVLANPRAKYLAARVTQSAITLQPKTRCPGAARPVRPAADRKVRVSLPPENFGPCPVCGEQTYVGPGASGHGGFRDDGSAYYCDGVTGTTSLGGSLKCES